MQYLSNSLTNIWYDILHFIVMIHKYSLHSACWGHFSRCIGDTTQRVLTPVYWLRMGAMTYHYASQDKHFCNHEKQSTHWQWRNAELRSLLLTLERKNYKDAYMPKQSLFANSNFSI